MMRLLNILLVLLIISSCSTERVTQNNIELEIYEEILSIKKAVEINNANIKNIEEKIAYLENEFQYMNNHKDDSSISDLRDQYNPFNSIVIPNTINDISEDAVILIKDDAHKDADMIYSLNPSELRSKLEATLDEN